MSIENYTVSYEAWRARCDSCKTVYGPERTKTALHHWAILAGWQLNTEGHVFCPRCYTKVVIT